MHLRNIRPVYDADGPYATVYLEARSPAEDAPTQVQLRWEALRRDLSEAGAPEPVLTSVEEALSAHDAGEVQADGRVLVAAGSGVLIDEAWDAALGAGDAAHWSQQPELGAYAREKAGAVRVLVAVADQQGAIVRHVVATDEHRLDPRSEATVDSASDAPVQKPRGGALSHNQIQRRADEAVKQNARGVAEHLSSVQSRWNPDVLVLAGEVQGRTAVRNELSVALQDIVREVDSGGTDDDAAEEALAQEIRRIAGETSEHRASELTGRYEEAKAHGRAAQGASAVAAAAQMGAIDTLILQTERTADREAHLLAAAVRGDGHLGLVNDEVEDGVAAVLRFEAPKEVSSTSR